MGFNLPEVRWVSGDLGDCEYEDPDGEGLEKASDASSLTLTFTLTDPDGEGLEKASESASQTPLQPYEAPCQTTLASGHLVVY